MQAAPRDPISSPGTAPGSVPECELVDGRETMTLQPRGAGRFAGAAFLSLWLCGWLLGETFALTALLGTLLATFAPAVIESWGLAGRVPAAGGGGAFVLVFLSVWLTFWTMGGLAAMRELLRMLAARDRVRVGGGVVELDQRLGPFRHRSEVPVDGIRRVVLDRRRRAVTLDTADGPVVVTELGTPEERMALAAWLRGALGIPRAGIVAGAPHADRSDALPVGWESEPDPDGAGVLLRRAAPVRRSQSALLFGIAAVAGAAFLATVVPALRAGATLRLFGALPALFVGAAFAIGALYLRAGGRVLAVGAGRVEERRFVVDRWRVRPCAVSVLALELQRDSDGDERHRLVAHGERTLPVAASPHGAAELLQLGRWLAPRLGVRFDVPETLADD